MEFISGLVNAQHDLVCVGTGTRSTIVMYFYLVIITHVFNFILPKTAKVNIHANVSTTYGRHILCLNVYMWTHGSWYRAVKRETCLFCKKIFKKHSQIKYSFIVYLLQNKLFLVLLSFNDVNSRLWSFADLLLDLKHVTCTHTW